MSKAGLRIGHCTVSLQRATMGELMRFARRSSDTQIIGLIDPRIEKTSIFDAEALPLWNRGSGACVLLVTNSCDPLAVELPATLLPFLPAVSPLAAVLVNAATLAAVSDPDEPLPQWLMHAVAAGTELNAVAADLGSHPVCDETQLPALRPATPRDAVSPAALQNLRPEVLVSRIRSQGDATALKAGLLQVNDLLDASHELSQSVEGDGRNAAGDYWHAIMHRREPDYSNAKYWFRRVGSHPIFVELAVRANALLDESPGVDATWRPRLLSGGWDPFAFVDLVESCPRSEADNLSRFARQLQWIEMQLLLRQTCRDSGDDD